MEEEKQRKSVNSNLWAIHRYYEYTSNEPMRRLATDMRQQEIATGRGKRRSLRFKDIPGVAAEQIEKLAAIDIVDVEGVLENGRTRDTPGQDGDYEMGIDPTITPTYGITGAYNTPAWTGVRFTDNGDGTVTDNLTALIWLRNANCWGYQNWGEALTNSNALADGQCGLTDGSSAGDWRLPNANELHSLIDLTQSNPALPSGHHFYAVQLDSYWSSTTVANVTVGAKAVSLNDGYVSNFDKSNPSRVWPVRSGE